MVYDLGQRLKPGSVSHAGADRRVDINTIISR